jgi:hypothetical protein
MRTKFLFAIFLATLFLQHGICHAKRPFERFSKTESAKAETTKVEDSHKFRFSIWPVVFGGGTFFFTELGPEEKRPGYSISGGTTIILNETIMQSFVTLFADALFSYRAYEGLYNITYDIKETTADFDIAAGIDNWYIGVYSQFPVTTKVKVREWTMNDFGKLSRNPSFSLMGGYRLTGEHLGLDARLLLGQGPGQFLRKAFGDSWLGQISLGIMAII